MKVTVCFGPVSVVVPCGNGDILVKDLINQAITRYRKASNKPNDPVAVSALRSSDGAILDPDDRLIDVVDDREQLAACLSGTEADPETLLLSRPRIELGLRGDGTSASSNSESPSPDFLHGASRKDIEVTGEEMGASDLLQVRRGSEPALNQITPGSNPSGIDSNVNDYKRWSAAPIVDPQSDSEEERRVIQYPSGPRFARSGARVSMQIFGGGNSGYRWAEAADNALLSSAMLNSPPDYEETMHRRTRSLRREPLGATSETTPLSDGESSSNGVMVILPNEGGPLGIHVVPDYSPSGSELGLLVQGIEPGGRVYRDGRIGVQDRIIEINGQPLKDVAFHNAQELFRNALQSRQLRLRIVKADFQHHSSGPPRMNGDESRRLNENNGMVHSEERVPGTSVARVAAVSPTRKPAPLPGTRASALMTVSTRKIGKKFEIELTKGAAGLGFSVTTRDNPAGGQCPIYIKNILPKGAAIEDGRLKSGDRLMEVNGVEMTGKSQDEVVTLLRNIPTGGIARLLVSRQETEEETSPKLPRQMKSVSRASEESLLLPWKQREILTLDIPVHDTEKAGLGISVKGKTSTGVNGTTDLGIFIKSVLHGGAASRDGRLLTNDQLLHVNGVPLLGRSNTEAMEALRRAVHQEGPKPGHITLTIARKALQNISDREAEGQADDTNSTVRIGGDSSGSNDHSGGSSDQSGSTVIFVSSASENRERNPLVDRLTGRQDLRNESYYRATHETWNTTRLQETVLTRPSNHQGKQLSQNSPTVHLPPGEVVSIDGDYVPQTRLRPTNGHETSRTTSPDVVSPPWGRMRSGPTDGRDWSEPQSPSEKDSVRSDRPSDSDAPTYASQTSLEDPNAPVFSRDQFGRQSMSEKRHATLDAKNTDTYQRNKKLREERERQKQTTPETSQQQQTFKENVPPTAVPDVRTARSPKDVGPTLGLKKSSSLESLQTAVQEIQMQEEEPEIGCYGYRPSAIRVVRGRGCNDSFRAAVDRSYEPNDTKEPMETLDEELPETNDAVPQTILPEPAVILDSKSDVRKSKKKQGLFRGLGSMFRFGKHRKSPPSPETATIESVSSTQIVPFHERRPSGPAILSVPRSDVDRHHVLRRTLPPDDRDRAELGRQMAVARQAAQEEQKRIQQHYIRLMEQQGQRLQQQQQQQQQQDDGTNRTQRLHQLRAQHQKRHVERQTMYLPQQQYEPNKTTIEIVHGRSSSYDPYNDVRKPRSRVAVGEPTTFVPMMSQPGTYNYDESQFNINRRQQHYHSQRSARETRPTSNGTNWSGIDRPVSNYFEYESLHIAGHTVAMSGPPYKSQQTHLQQQQHPGNGRAPHHPAEEYSSGSLTRRHERKPVPSNDFGTTVHGNRNAPRESVYGASTYGNNNNNNRAAPLAGSKV